VGGRALDAAEHDALASEIDSLEKLLLPGETLPRPAPALWPNTRGAVSGYAEAYGAGVADDVRRVLLAAHWTRGVNISSPETLRRLLAGPILRGRSSAVPLSDFGYAVSAGRGPVTTGAYRRIRDWSREWESLGARPLPLLVVDGWQPVSGETALRRLEKEILRVDAATAPALPEPDRYPFSGDRPDPRWVSEVGGRWRHAWKLHA
jgi:hypothetical protein